MTIITTAITAAITTAITAAFAAAYATTAAFATAFMTAATALLPQPIGLSYCDWFLGASTTAFIFYSWSQLHLFHVLFAFPLELIRLIQFTDKWWDVLIN